MANAESSSTTRKPTRAFWPRLLAALAWAWLLLALPALTDVACSFPVGIALAGSWLALAAAWLCLPLLAWSSLRSPAGRRWYLAAALAGCLDLVLTGSDVGLRWWLRACEPTLTAYAQAVPREMAERRPDPRRVGLFFVEETQEVDGVVLLYTGGGFINRPGRHAGVPASRWRGEPAEATAVRGGMRPASLAPAARRQQPGAVLRRPVPRRCRPGLGVGRMAGARWRVERFYFLFGDSWGGPSLARLQLWGWGMRQSARLPAWAQVAFGLFLFWPCVVVPRWRLFLGLGVLTAGGLSAARWYYGADELSWGAIAALSTALVWFPLVIIAPLTLPYTLLAGLLVLAADGFRRRGGHPQAADPGAPAGRQGD